MRKLKSQIGLYLDKNVAYRVREKCEKKHISLSDVVRNLLERWLKGDIKIEI